MKLNAPPANLDLRRQTAEAHLGEITWQSDGVGFCRCPGESFHTTGKGRRDCRVTLDGAPTIFCVHQRCAGARENANHALRSAIAKAELTGKAEVPTVGEIMRRRRDQEQTEARTREARELQDRARNELVEILDRCAWPECDVWEESPLRIEGPPQDDARLLMAHLFRPDDVVWSGQRHDSGKQEHAGNFKTAGEWLDADTIAGPLVSKVTFQPGSISRRDDAVMRTPFLVIEGDGCDPDVAAKIDRGEPLTPEDMERNRRATLAVMRWFRDEVGLYLCALVDSGAKSVHGWFTKPADNLVERLKPVLPALGCDAAMLRPSQPTRLPGVRRAETGRWQRLLYLDPFTTTP